MKVAILAIASILILRCTAPLNTVASNRHSNSCEISCKDVSLDSILSKARGIRTQRPEIKKEGKFIDFNFDLMDSGVNIEDTLKFPAEEYYLVGFDSLNQVVKVSRFSNSSLNYAVEIFRDSLFTIMNVSNFWYDTTHNEKKADYMKGCIIKCSEKYFFFFDSRVTHPLFENAFNLTSIKCVSYSAKCW